MKTIVNLFKKEKLLKKKTELIKKNTPEKIYNNHFETPYENKNELIETRELLDIELIISSNQKIKDNQISDYEKNHLDPNHLHRFLHDQKNNLLNVQSTVSLAFGQACNMQRSAGWPLA